MMPGHDGQPAQDIPGWRLWVSATGRHWAIRCHILTAAQIGAGARPLLWAQDHPALATLISAQPAQPTGHSGPAPPPGR